MSLSATKLQRTIEEKLQNRPGVRRAIGNLNWLFWDRLARILTGMLTAVWMMRMLGPSQYGLMTWSAAWYFCFSVMATLGLDSLVVREVVRFPEEKNSILGTTFFMKLIGAVLAFALSVGAFAFYRPHLGTSQHLLEALVSMYAAIGLCQAFDAIDFWFQSQIATKYVVYAKSAAFFTMTAARLWLIHIHAPVYAFPATMLVEAILGAAGLYVSYTLNHNDMRDWRFDLRWMKTLLSDSWPIMLAGIAITFQARMDQLMLGTMVSKTELGEFAAALNVIEAFGFIPMVIYSAVTPLIVKAKEAGDDVYYGRLCDLYRLMFIAFVVVAVPLFFLGKPVIVFLLGSKYARAGALVGLMSIRLLFANFGVARQVFVLSANLFRYTLTTAIIGTALNAGLNYWLIPHYRSVGAIVVMIVSFFVTTFLFDFFYPPVQRNMREMLRAIVTPWRLSLS